MNQSRQIIADLLLEQAHDAIWDQEEEPDDFPEVGDIAGLIQFLNRHGVDVGTRHGEFPAQEGFGNSRASVVLANPRHRELLVRIKDSPLDLAFEVIDTGTFALRVNTVMAIPPVADQAPEYEKVVWGIIRPAYTLQRTEITGPHQFRFIFG